MSDAEDSMPAEGSHGRDALPERVGPYRVTGRLGRGGMGEVLEGWDDRLDRPVALKRVLPDARHPDRARQRFRREARAVARLSDSAIVQVYDWVEVGEHDWLVMEKVEGQPVDQVLADGLPPRDQALRIAREVASGLATAHEAGLVHRDLKASNIMLLTGEDSTPDRIKILDFGIAKPLMIRDGAPPTTLTAEGQLVGTFNAMSPEQALAQPVDHRSDLFSLGTLLYEMLSGEQPFVRPNPVETLSRICSWKQPALHRLDPRIFPEVSPEISRLVDHLLAKEPARRPADARQVVAALDQLLMAGAAQSDPSAETLDQPTRIDGMVDAVVDPGEGAPAAPAAPASGRPWGGHRGSLLIGLALAALFGGWQLMVWLEPAPGPPPLARGALDTAQTEDEALDRHQLFQRGMTRLGRYDREGNVAEAIADFQRSLALDEDYAPALAGLARAYWLDSVNDNQDPARRQQALAVARRAVEADPFLALARISLGMSLRQMGALDEAGLELERALELEPGNALALFELGQVHAARQEPARAEELYSKAVEAESANWLFPCNLGVFYYDEGRWDEAETAFLRSLELTPDNYLVHRNLGAVYSIQGKLDDAASQFQRALQIRPDDSVYTNLGNIQFAQGLYPQAVAAFEKAIETGGGNYYYSWGNLGDAYRWTPDNEERAREAYRRALQLLDQELAILPDDPTLRTRRALYHAKIDACDWDPVKSRKTEELSQGDASAWFRLATAHEICGRRDAALTALGKALRAGYPPGAIAGDIELRQLRQDARYHRLVMDFE